MFSSDNHSDKDCMIAAKVALWQIQLATTLPETRKSFCQPSFS